MNSQSTRELRSDRHQQGVALVVGMVFLVALSLTAIIAMNRTILQERMTGAYRAEQIAYAGAEAALRAGEWSLWQYPLVRNLTSPPVPLPGQDLDCLVVCAGEGRYRDGQTTKLQSFKGEAAGTLNTSAQNAYIGMVRNDGFLAAGEGSQAAYPPVVFREALGKEPPDESLVIGQSGLEGSLLYFRLTARGYGPTPDVQRSVQSTFSLVR